MKPLPVYLGTPDDLRSWLTSIPSHHFFSHQPTGCVISQYLTARNAGLRFNVGGSTYSTAWGSEYYREGLLPQWAQTYIRHWDYGQCSPGHVKRHLAHEALALLNQLYPPQSQTLPVYLQDNAVWMLPVTPAPMPPAPKEVPEPEPELACV